MGTVEPRINLVINRYDTRLSNYSNLKMLRHIIKSCQLMRTNLVRSAGGGGGSGGAAGSSDGGGAEGSKDSAFARNCVSKEQQLSEALRRALPSATYVSVSDVSGGCGAMYEISVEASEFSGLSRVAQHRLVTDSLKEEIAAMHGLRIHTAVPPPRHASAPTPQTTHKS